MATTRARGSCHVYSVDDEAARIEPSQRDDPAVKSAIARFAKQSGLGLARLAELVGEPLSNVAAV